MFGIKEDRKNKTGAIRYVTFRKKDRVDQSSLDDDSLVRLFATPEAAAKLLQLSSRAVSRARTSIPIPEKRSSTEPSKRVARIAPASGIGREETSQTPSRETLERLPQLEKAVVRETIDSAEKSEPEPSDGKIRTANLRDFALKRLPEGSILREVILLEQRELTPEQFLSKLPIWLRLFDRSE
jgi:hypothetical protein